MLNYIKNPPPKIYGIMVLLSAQQRLAKNTSLQQKIGDSQSFLISFAFPHHNAPFSPTSSHAGGVRRHPHPRNWLQCGPSYLQICFCVCYFVFWVVGLFVLVGLIVCVFSCFSWKFSLPSFLCLLTCCLLSSILSSFLANRRTRTKH